MLSEEKAALFFDRVYVFLARKCIEIMKPFCDNYLETYYSINDLDKKNNDRKVFVAVLNTLEFLRLQNQDWANEEVFSIYSVLYLSVV